MPDSQVARCRVVFRGSVQGVGFRFTTMSTAKHYPVIGYVMNSPDGSVLLVLEGPRDGVSKMIQSVLARMSGLVRDHSEEWSAATGEFAGFSIRH